jgi:DNA-binding NarL/FixJ family response regulator
MSSSEPIRILVVDDQALVRRGIVMLVDSTDDMTVVGEARDGAEALAIAKTMPVDVALMDIRMAVMDGIEATRLLRSGDTHTRVLVLTTFDQDEYVFAALKAGAAGFILKDSEPTFLLDAIRSVANGGSVIAPTSAKRLFEFVAPRLPDLAEQVSMDTLLPKLTDREQEILKLLAAGATNNQIAESVSLTETTVKAHVSHILAKAGCRNRVELAIIVQQAGFIPDASELAPRRTH